MGYFERVGVDFVYVIHMNFDLRTDKTTKQILRSAPRLSRLKKPLDLTLQYNTSELLVYMYVVIGTS